MIDVLVLLTTVFATAYLFSSKNKGLLLPTVLMMGIVLIVQWRSTTPTRFSRNEMTEMEKVNQTRLMNEYPPFAYRLANILEARQESITYFKLERNFVNIFDLDLLFGKVWMFFLFPFFLVGLMNMIRDQLLLAMIMGVPSLVLLTTIGHQSLYGFVSLYPIIYTSIIYGAISILGEQNGKTEGE